MPIQFEKSSLLTRTAIAVLAFVTTQACLFAGEPLHRVAFVGADKKSHNIEGKLVVEAQDGGIVLQTRDGVLWTITPKQLKQRRKTAEAFKPHTADELAKRLKAEFGAGFDIKKTRRYVICSDAGRHYTNWCAILLERVSSAFLKQWDAKALPVKEPAHPLIAIIFNDRKRFAAYATKDAGPQMASSVGYYSIRTNRIVLLDLTSGRNARPARSRSEVIRKVARSPFNVATIAHEATHQIAFNTGLHTRYADNPLWLTEGMAMYFESPQAGSTSGWKSVGKVNPFRLRPFRKFAEKARPANSLKTLVSSDKRFTAEKTAPSAYAEAWALTFFLIRKRREDYEKYLKVVSKKSPLIFDTPAERWKDFQTAFGDPAKLEREFLEYLSNPRLR